MRGWTNQSQCADLMHLRTSSKTGGLHQAAQQRAGSTNRSSRSSVYATYAQQKSLPPSSTIPSSGAINVKTLQGLPSASPRRQTAPPSCASPSSYAHRRDPRGAMPPRLAAVNVVDVHRSTSCILRPATAPKTMPPRGRATPIAPPSSDPRNPGSGVSPGAARVRR